MVDLAYRGYLGWPSTHYCGPRYEYRYLPSGELSVVQYIVLGIHIDIAVWSGGLTPVAVSFWKSRPVPKTPFASCSISGTAGSYAVSKVPLSARLLPRRSSHPPYSPASRQVRGKHAVWLSGACEISRSDELLTSNIDRGGEQQDRLPRAATIHMKGIFERRDWCSGLRQFF
jgi:hypothetical protein